MSGIRSQKMKMKKLLRFQKKYKSSSPPRQEFILSNHAQVNWERKLRGLPPLKRSRFLDDLAREHADEMASRQLVFHSVQSVSQLRCKLNSNRAGENTISGSSISKMMRILLVGAGMAPEMLFMKKVNPNILNKEFIEFGMACVKGTDGLLYLVQYFRGEQIFDLTVSEIKQ